MTPQQKHRRKKRLERKGDGKSDDDAQYLRRKVDHDAPGDGFESARRCIDLAAHFADFVCFMK